MALTYHIILPSTPYQPPMPFNTGLDLHIILPSTPYQPPMPSNTGLTSQPYLHIILPSTPYQLSMPSNTGLTSRPYLHIILPSTPYQLPMPFNTGLTYTLYCHPHHTSYQCPSILALPTHYTAIHTIPATNALQYWLYRNIILPSTPYQPPMLSNTGLTYTLYCHPHHISYQCPSILALPTHYIAIHTIPATNWYSP